MSDVIYKFQLVDWVHAEQRGELPPPSLAGPVVHVGPDPHGLACVWIRGNPDEVPPRRRFAVAGTGQELDPSWVHLGAYNDGPFIWHVFEVVTDG